MAKRFHLSERAANAAVDAVCGLASDGFLRIYGGPEPADADEPIAAAHTLLAELRFSAPAYEKARDGEAQTRPILSEMSAKAEGKARWFRAVMANGMTGIFDGSVGTKASDLNLNTIDIAEGMVISVSTLPYRQPRKK